MFNYLTFFEPRSSPSVRVVKLGRLNLPSGHVYCCDPFLSHEVNAIETTLSPGAYDVDVCVVVLPDWGLRVALARLVLSSRQVVEWQDAMFVIGGARQSEFRVDSGLACFMDQTTQKVFVRVVSDFHATSTKANYYDELLAEQFKRNADPSNHYHAGDWAMHTPVTGDERNLAMFASGLGDGMYRAHWGMDAAGHPATLVADFDVLPLEDPSDPTNYPLTRA